MSVSLKTIEIRRHSIRSKPGDYLNQAGVSLARRVGDGLGPFQRVVTSTLPRAFETAIAMGFAVDEEVGLISTYGSDIERQVPWPQSFAVYAKGARRAGSAAQWYASQLVEYYAGLTALLDEGQAALVINHGGVLELGVVASFPSADYESWGDAVDYCEGARLYWQDGKFVMAEVLRVA